MSVFEFSFRDQTLLLDPFQVIYWKEEDTLLLSDVHLGKTHHFRKHGFGVPPEKADENYWVLDGMLCKYNPRQVIFLGDLFHSEINPDWDRFTDFIRTHPEHRWVLVKGNHDIFSDEYYMKAGLELYQETLEMGPFLLAHKPMISDRLYTICGHLHPAVSIQGRGRQRLRLRCFYFSRKFGVLPAFGAFTGTNAVRPKSGDQVFGIASGKVIELA